MDMFGDDDDRKAAERRVLRAERDRDDWQWLLNDERGRRILRGLLDGCAPFATGVSGSAQDYYRAGRRDVGVGLFETIMATDPQAYILMMRERDNA